MASHEASYALLHGASPQLILPLIPENNSLCLQNSNIVSMSFSATPMKNSTLATPKI